LEKKGLEIYEKKKKKKLSELEKKLQHQAFDLDEESLRNRRSKSLQRDFRYENNNPFKNISLDF
jgi:hypothetical protein